MRKWLSKNSNICHERRAGMRRLFRLAILSLILAQAPASLATDSPQEGSQYAYDRWGRENGLLWGAATSIAQSTDGYLWIGTERGLVRFDGYSFSLYDNVGSGVKIGAVRQLLTDRQGNLWILLATTELLRYHDGKFEAGRDEAQFGITAIGQRRDGSPLFSSSSFGPLTYTDGRYQRAVVADSSVSGATAAPPRGDTLSSHLSWATGVMPHRYVETDSPAASITETVDGTVWLG